MKTPQFNWTRTPFYGGVRYYAQDVDLMVVGYYPTTHTETSCHEWQASNLDGNFGTLEAAIDAAERAHTDAWLLSLVKEN